ncbi:hypothetical protein E4U17_007041 [Claviceps sp. LM77 group G4]|nr:hypothetical protein E4U17_007041 [Claviceps sp. LM77 group G4]KAG6071638.1 hypothetical protein E4U33_003607 [Claviceps sp. LM78 group G4]
MASVTSHNNNTSPHLLSNDFEFGFDNLDFGFDFDFDFDFNFDSNTTGDDESWQQLDGFSSGASAQGSVGFLSSPASGSLNGYALVGYPARLTPPEVSSVSPLLLGDMEGTTSLPGGEMFTGLGEAQSEYFMRSSVPGVVASGPDSSSTMGWGPTVRSGVASLLTPQALMSSGTARPFTQGELQQDLHEMMNFQTNLVSSMHQSSTSVVGLPEEASMTTQPLFAPNELTVAPRDIDKQNMTSGQRMSFDDLNTSPQWSVYTPSTSSVSSPRKSPAVKPEVSLSYHTSSSSLTAPLPIPKVKTGKVEKRKASTYSKFVIMTPDSMHAQAGRPNPFECFEAMHASHRGRKGPLAHEAKQNALLVRGVGACFCCQHRKVKCDKERPCQHCKRLMMHVPQVMCWQFQDFLPVLFPDFIRSHFKKDAMAAFLRDNIQEWSSMRGVDEQEKQQQQVCEVELFSGLRFSAVLSVQAKVFTAKTCEVLQHWHLTPMGGRAEIQAGGSVPLGVEFKTAAERDVLRKRIKAYVQAIIQEPCFPEQVTDSLRSTRLPVKILDIVQTYAKQSDSCLVKRALSIYAMHYIMTRHLCLTNKSILTLQPSGLIPHQNTPWITPRVLARQIKSLTDELIMREMQHLFDTFSQVLKQKHRREWAPCTAAFLVLCLFMEAVETTAGNFALSQNEINRRNAAPPQYGGDFTRNVCRELENLPFKQFAYQFHAIYQTHARDVNTRCFNPLFGFGAGRGDEQGDLDGPAEGMVRSLRELFYGESWRELQFLADDEIVLHEDERAHPIESSFLYTGRLVAKFLLSFTSEEFIFGGQT